MRQKIKEFLKKELSDIAPSTDSSREQVGQIQLVQELFKIKPHLVQIRDTLQKCNDQAPIQHSPISTKPFKNKYETLGNR